VTSCGKQLAYASSVETSFRQTERCSQTSTSSTNDNCIIFVILQEAKLDLVNEQWIVELMKDER